MQKKALETLRRHLESLNLLTEPIAAATALILPPIPQATATSTLPPLQQNLLVSGTGLKNKYSVKEKFLVVKK